MAEKQKRGFALMDSKAPVKLSRLGGKAAQTKGTAHHWTPEEARAYGSKGGKRVRPSA